MFNGVLLVLAACFVWGLIFVIPQLLMDFSPIEVAFGRYLCFGLISLCLMLLSGLKWRSFSRNTWLTAIIYAFIVNIFYYSSLVIGLRYSSPSVIALILGISPITISLCGNWQHKECKFRHLIFPSCLITIGLVFVNIPAFQSDHVRSLSDYIFGLICGFFSLISWNWYVLANAKFLKNNPQIESSDWANLIGVGTLFWVFVLIGLFTLVQTSWEPLEKYFVWTPQIKGFLIGILILGLACSWLGAYLWNHATKTLPISLAGQLTIFETIFGLIFVYLAEGRLPVFLEFLGIMVILSGVILSMQIFKKGKLALETSLHTA